ncbi:alpha/beta hydrolase [Pseudonocardia alni]|uniref:alpha/beta hydrolase n=1 Tax=Pseudonocardia alni TaxID=33907 RepID=UPI00331DACDE
MHITGTEHLDDHLTEHRFTLDGVPGIRWTPRTEPRTAPRTTGGPDPLVLLGHPGDLPRMYPRLLGRARSCAADGYTAATLELPGSGGRPRLPGVDAARADLRRALRAGEPVPDAVVDRLVTPLVEASVPEWRALLAALPGHGPVAWSGGITALGVRMAREPRIVAALLFAGSHLPRTSIDEARRVTVPVLMLLQWDDECNDRRQALELFDALGSPERTLHANTGGHTGVPAFEGEDAARFLARHLR